MVHFGEFELLIFGFVMTNKLKIHLNYVSNTFKLGSLFLCLFNIKNIIENPLQNNLGSWHEVQNIANSIKNIKVFVQLIGLGMLIVNLLHPDQINKRVSLTNKLHSGSIGGYRRLNCLKNSILFLDSKR